MNENQKLETIMKELIRFSLPLILSGVLQQLYNWADAFIVGNVDGELSLSAIGVTSIPISFFITTITGFTLGLSVLIAKNFGAKKQDSIPPVLAVFAVILGGVFLLAATVGSALSYPFMELLHTPADTIDLASGYIRIIFWGLPFLAVYNVYTATLRGLGDSRIPFLSILVVLSQAIMTVFIVLYGTWKYPWLKSNCRKESFCGAVVRDGLRYGLPPMVQSSISALGSLVLQDFMNRFGTDTVTAITTAYRIDTLILLPIVNLGSGISTVTAHSHGAGDTIRTRKTLSAGTILTLVVSAFLTGLVIPTGGKIIALFGAGTAAVAIGSAFFHRIAFFYPIFGLTTAFRGYLEGRGDLVYSSVAGLVSLAVRIIASYAMAPHFGNMTIAYAEMVSWVWLLVMYLFRLAAKKDDAL